MQASPRMMNADAWSQTTLDRIGVSAQVLQECVDRVRVSIVKAVKVTGVAPQKTRIGGHAPLELPNNILLCLAYLLMHTTQGLQALFIGKVRCFGGFWASRSAKLCQHHLSHPIRPLFMRQVTQTVQRDEA